MFKLSEIKELIKLVDQTSVHELEIENEGMRLSIRKPGRTEVVNVQAPSFPTTYLPSAPIAQTAPIAAPAASSEEAKAAPAADTSNLHRIVSPMVGTFYRSPSPDASPFVNIGDRVSDKTVVCILEAMKLMNPLEAEVKGEIVDILVENGQLVEFGQPLFLVKPE
ncbi:acetyl-CoA carboxylase, biotin carboxyl carrier protein [Cohnella sp. CIP 111063]|uniref:acetyl-CoA carboxylase biotin carboxyl carrier protein n=1 Tax=unclassified Cohnella TaxID=2636738 RepID=UPI000B8C2058|nr:MULTISPECIES: acetyl-CoA carboxylase biotin carboxyl carrier protein [unclassified Cohnella]OXS52398.1 acetyl-CoA carboxylase, biotin carboxyl carrier protein [Cohnella sp. CIP 111063]PRX58255.1 biotin carboxyl carrier protein [Cohnella sp. SGD-V74]